jgi:uncharacterized protein with FMN-binding domain
MKKFILSIFVMASFGFYVIFQNTGNSSDNFIVPTIAVTPTNNTKQSPKTVVVVPTTPILNNRQPTPTPVPKKIGIYNDGQYTGNSADAYYGYVQVKAIITNGILSDVVFLDYPQDRRTSTQINNYAMPILRQEAIAAQSANVNAVSGASATSPAFVESLTSALNQARA